MPNEILLKHWFPARPELMKQVRTLVQEAAGKTGCPEQAVQGMVLAVHEAIANIIEHAYKGDPAGEISLKMQKNGSRLEFQLTDFASPADVSAIKPRALEDIKPGGLGTHFINISMDEVTYSQLPDGKGNLLVMIKNI